MAVFRVVTKRISERTKRFRETSHLILKARRVKPCYKPAVKICRLSSALFAAHFLAFLTDLCSILFPRDILGMEVDLITTENNTKAAREIYTLIIVL
jgi:hypothetical protein